MTAEAEKPLRVFCSYSRRDEEHLNDLRSWLRGLERRGLIQWRHDREIVPGWEWEEAIDKNLRSADVILLLVSPDFMASDYVYENEISRAVERHERGEARIIPIIVRPSDWEDAPFYKIQAVPKDARPITRWPDRDEAWLDVLRGVRRAVEELLDERQEQANKERYREAVEGAGADNDVSAAEAQGLSSLASELGLSTETAAEIERDVMGSTVDVLLEHQERVAREKELERRLEELYARARKLHRDQEWQSVMDVMARIHSEDPAHQDPEGLLVSARDALDIAGKEEEALRQYREGVESAWADGELDSREVETLRDLADKHELDLRKTVEIEREVMGDTLQAILQRQAREKEERQERLDELYAQARTLHQDQEWQAVIGIFAQIHTIDPEFPDSEGVLVSARQALKTRESAITGANTNRIRSLRTLKGHTYTVNSVGFSPDGRLLASGSADGTVRLWGIVKAD